jgi:hypothetical protein
VACPEDPTELRPLPAHGDLERHVEGPGDRPQRRERDALETTLLDPGDGPAAHAGPLGDVALAPPSSHADRPEGAADGLVVHPAMVTLAACPGPIGPDRGRPPVARGRIDRRAAAA